MRLVSVLLLLLGVALAKPSVYPYGKPVQFYLGKPLQFADLEITFDGGGSSQGRGYRAFRAVGKGKQTLVLWFDDQGKPVGFKLAGQAFQLEQPPSRRCAHPVEAVDQRNLPVTQPSHNPSIKASLVLAEMEGKP